MGEGKWYGLTTLLELVKDGTFPLITPILCKPIGGDPFMIFASNHGIFLDLSMTNNCTIFDIYELEDLLKWEYQIPNVEHISLLRGKNRIISLIDKEHNFFMVFMNGRKLTFFDIDSRSYVFIEDIAKNQAETFYNFTINIDGSRIDNLEDFMDSSFIPEDEEVYLINNKLDEFYKSVNNRMMM